MLETAPTVSETLYCLEHNKHYWPYFYSNLFTGCTCRGLNKTLCKWQFLQPRHTGICKTTLTTYYRCSALALLIHIIPSTLSGLVPKAFNRATLNNPKQYIKYLLRLGKSDNGGRFVLAHVVKILHSKSQDFKFNPHGILKLFHNWDN